MNRILSFQNCIVDLKLPNALEIGSSRHICFANGNVDENLDDQDRKHALTAEKVLRTTMA